MRSLLINKARDTIYSIKEFWVLYGLVEEYCVERSPLEPMELRLFLDILSKDINVKVKVGSTYILGYEVDISRELTFFQYLLVYHRRIFLFLRMVSLKRVLLYLDDPLLRPFVLFRMRIGV